MTGWHTQIDGEYEPPSGVIGIVVAPKFPDLDIIREKIREGAERRPDDVWVVREKPQANHAVNAVWETLDELGIEPLLVPLVPAFRIKTDEVNYDGRRKWADAEMRSTCDRIIVFHDKSSNVTADWIEYDGRDKPYIPGRDRCIARIFVIERGKKKPVKRRTGRKPE